MTFKHVKEITINELNNASGHLINCDNGKSYWLQIDSDTSNIICADDNGNTIFEKPHDEPISVFADGKAIIDGILYLCFTSKLIDFNNIGNDIESVIDSVARFERGLIINKERLVWDGSIKSTKEIIELLGDTVGHDTVSQEKFHDYVDSVRRSGLSHPKLGSQVLKIGQSIIRISDFR